MIYCIRWLIDAYGCVCSQTHTLTSMILVLVNKPVDKSTDDPD